MTHMLSSKIQEFSKQLTPLERENLKILLSTSCEDMVTTAHREPADGKFTTAMETLANIQPHSSRVSVDGVQWTGRPSFMQDSTVEALIAESRLLRPLARRFDDHRVSKGQSVALEVGYSTAFSDLVQTHAGAARFSGRCNYTYYDEPGMGVDPHVDNVEFPLIAITMLSHKMEEGAARDPSGTMIFRRGQEPKRYLLQPGELLLLYSDSVMHSRVRMQTNEEVTIIVFGFEPIC